MPRALRARRRSRTAPRRRDLPPVHRRSRGRGAGKPGGDRGRAPREGRGPRPRQRDRPGRDPDQPAAQPVLRYQAEANALHRSYTEPSGRPPRRAACILVENTVIDTPAPAPVPIDEPVVVLSTNSSDEARNPSLRRLILPGTSPRKWLEMFAAAIEPAKSDTGRRVPGEIALRWAVKNGWKPVEATLKVDANGPPGRVGERRRLV